MKKGSEMQNSICGKEAKDLALPACKQKTGNEEKIENRKWSLWRELFVILRNLNVNWKLRYI